MFNPLISTHAPAGGATLPPSSGRTQPRISTHAPAGGATRSARTLLPKRENFYSRPCGRGDPAQLLAGKAQRKFLLTPLREGRPPPFIRRQRASVISTHAPAGGATFSTRRRRRSLRYFYSRPCGRGDLRLVALGRDGVISTHAPAGGATAIFHKSVMRFCGKLPKDDTVLCLASFGFPRRDPKAVYLAWISCANLPQKCVRQGLALKDQGTSCFHEGLASHAFDPVLV